MGRGVRCSLVGAGTALAVIIAAPFLIPVSHFIPHLELFASEKLGQPVTIGALRLHLLPTPRMVAEEIRVGRREELAIGELELVPELLSFVSGPRTLRRVRAERVEMHHSALKIPRGMPRGDGGQGTRIRRVELIQARLYHPHIKLPPLDADLALSESLRLEHATFKARDGSVILEVEPAASGTSVLTLRAKDWTLPAGPPLRFQALAARAILKGTELEIAHFEGWLYGGKVEAATRVGWGKQWSLEGKAQIGGVELAAVQEAFGKQAKLSGKLRARASFSSRARSAHLLREALLLEGPFDVAGGVYKGVDLAKAGELDAQRDGTDATTFEELHGRLQLRGRHMRVEALCVRSPSVIAGGSVEIAPDEALSGKLDVSVAKTGGFVGVPVSLGGTTNDPSVRPTRGYVIGALLGTVLLPGLGTTIGSSLGGKIDGAASGCK